MMINIYIYFIFMFLGFIFMFNLSILLYYYDFSMMMEWMFLSVSSMNMELIFLLDWVSVMFISVIFLISSMIMIYSMGYMEGDKFLKRFIYLVIMFIFSMILMIISPNIISILFGWDGLGLVSYCLVIYYQNYMSYNSGMVTVLCNRVGDVGILMMVGLMLVSGGWNIWSMSMGKLLLFMMLLAAISKSAQIPFSTWLPMAMAAPTPVSALVHSSTLVTAGVYLMIRFNKFLLGSGVGAYLFFLSVLTMLMAGIMANVENDLKKIIALSTLSQLGLMMMILSLGFSMVAFYHLLTHAIFKSLLFMCAGIMIHSMMNNQDIRLLGNLNEIIPFTMMSFYISNLALCGMPFISGFYSKDLIMELIYSFKVNALMLVLIVISLMFTVSYSFRLFYYLFFNNFKFYSYYNFSESKVMNMSMISLVVMSILIGSMLNWMFFYNLYIIHLDFSTKSVTLVVCMLGVFLGWAISVISKHLIKAFNLVYFLSSMWFLNYMYMWVYNPVNKLGGYAYYVDKIWVEFMSKNMIFYIIQYKKFVFNYKIYMFGFIMIYLGLMMKLFI
uniref:NADH-ubiquinone oxidoreductase chain 5 n=1 Tax=Solenopsis invicta TaxID=13686 RepID=E3VRV1_SOLIN|nr:NADH dehydrogenase subunit 5 [Solenopsis invicta]ADP01790.1 NADH dehydrogenase subunit 5 [Solenopsis invicta]